MTQSNANISSVGSVLVEICQMSGKLCWTVCDGPDRLSHFACTHVLVVNPFNSRGIPLVIFSVHKTSAHTQTPMVTQSHTLVCLFPLKSDDSKAVRCYKQWLIIQVSYSVEGLLYDISLKQCVYHAQQTSRMWLPNKRLSSFNVEMSLTL